VPLPFDRGWLFKPKIMNFVLWQSGTIWGAAGARTIARLAADSGFSAFYTQRVLSKVAGQLINIPAAALPEATKSVKGVSESRESIEMPIVDCAKSSVTLIFDVNSPAT
jgi:hypothetical protein